MNQDDLGVDIDTDGLELAKAHEAMVASAVEVGMELGFHNRPQYEGIAAGSKGFDRVVDAVDNLELRAVLAASGGDCTEQDLNALERDRVRRAIYLGLGHPL